MAAGLAILLFSLAISSSLQAQNPNLIENPSNDEPLINGEIPGWQEVSGTTWTQRCSSPDAQEGTCYFYPGVCSQCMLVQDIDLSDLAMSIDAGEHEFHFTGYVRAFQQSPADESNIELRFLSAQGDTLSSTILGPYDQTAEWLQIDTILSTPAGSRTCKLALHSIRHNGSNNDGYYDNLMLQSLIRDGITALGELYGTHLFPNPSTGPFTITSDATGPVDVTLYASTGQQVGGIRHFAASESITVNPGDLAPGAYIVEVARGQHTARMPLLIQY